MVDITATLKDLRSTAHIYAVEQRGECREIFVSAQRGSEIPLMDIPIYVVDADNAYPIFTFTKEEENNANVNYKIPLAGNILHEPSPAAMKAGGFKIMAERFHLDKVHPNTHLYLGDLPRENFPGKKYIIEEVFPFSSGIMKRFARSVGNASVAVRNFPMTAEVLRKKLKCGESSCRRIIGTTVADGTHRLLLVAPLS